MVVGSSIPFVSYFTSTQTRSIIDKFYWASKPAKIPLIRKSEILEVSGEKTDKLPQIVEAKTTIKLERLSMKETKFQNPP